MKLIRRLLSTALIAGLAAAAAFAAGEGEGDGQMSAPAAEMMAEYGDVWQWEHPAGLPRPTPTDKSI